MIDVVGDGTCLCNSVNKDAFIQGFIRKNSLKIEDGFALRLYVIDYMHEHHPAVFLTLCSEMHQVLGKGDGDLSGKGVLAKL